MGDLFEKKVGKFHGHSNPTDHGFKEWFTSQAQLPTSTPNCGCFPKHHDDPGTKVGGRAVSVSRGLLCLSV